VDGREKHWVSLVSIETEGVYIMNVITIGTDSEFFLFERETNKFVPAYRITKGTKSNPERIYSKNNFEVFVHWDNVALEVTASPVEYNPDEPDIKSYLHRVYTILKNWLSATHPDLYISTQPVVEIDKEILFDEEAGIFGCEPDFNIWTMKENPPPSPVKAGYKRTAGAHLHFGMDEITDETVSRLVKTLDEYMAACTFVYIPIPYKQMEEERRSLYGMAGSFRLKPYGVEYRVLSPTLFDNLSPFDTYLIRAISLSGSDEMEVPKSIPTKIKNHLNFPYSSEKGTGPKTKYWGQVSNLSFDELAHLINGE
jgi:hypothetical protein